MKEYKNSTLDSFLQYKTTKQGLLPNFNLPHSHSNCEILNQYNKIYRNRVPVNFKKVGILKRNSFFWTNLDKFKKKK